MRPAANKAKNQIDCGTPRDRNDFLYFPQSVLDRTLYSPTIRHGRGRGGGGQDDRRGVAGADEEQEKTTVVGAGDTEDKMIVVAGAADTSEDKLVVAGEADEEEADGGWDDGGGGGQFLLAPGYRFAPSDDELVMYYLLPKLQGRECVPNDAIIVADVYQCHPDQLIDMYRHRGDNSWHFLKERDRKYENGKRPGRHTKDRRGRWKASTGKKAAGGDGGCKKKVTSDGATTYWKSVLAYFEGTKIANERKSNWLMKEYTVPEYENKLLKDGGPAGMTLDKDVMCKIYVSPRDKNEECDDEAAGPSNAVPQLGPAVESGQGTTAGHPPKLSKKLAGKRPAEDQQLDVAAPTTKRAHHGNRLHLGAAPAPPLQGNAGMQAPFRPPGSQGVPGRPMGYYARAPMPQPAMAHSNEQPRMAFNGQAPHAPRQPAASNMQMPVMTRQQPMAYNGQMPAMQQQVAFNGQNPAPRQQVAFDGQNLMPRQQVAFNGQVKPTTVLKLSPMYRAVGSPNRSGQNQAMMTRPSCPADQAVNPSSAVAQTQKQPETDEMRVKRVLQQNLEEFLPMQQQQQQRMATFTVQQQQQQYAIAFMHHQQRPRQQQQKMMFAHHQQQQQKMALARQLQQQQYHQQRPYLGTNTGYHQNAGAMVPRLSLDNFYPSEAAQQYESSRVVLPKTSGSAVETASITTEGSPASTMVSVEVKVEGNNGNRDNHDRYEHNQMVLPMMSGSVGEAATVAVEGLPDSTMVSVEENEKGGNGDCDNHDWGESAVVKVLSGDASASAH